ncbi:hypothetical protein PN603_13320, partial [Parabacteroides distasonis]
LQVVKKTNGPLVSIVPLPFPDNHRGERRLMYIKTVTHLFIKMDENLGGCAFYVDDIKIRKNCKQSKNGY